MYVADVRIRTFQESILSQRVLMFTDYQMSYYCGSSAQFEGLGEFLLSKSKGSDTVSPSVILPRPWNKQTRVTWLRYAALVTLYSVRKLTY